MSLLWQPDPGRKAAGYVARLRICWWEDDPVQFADPEYRGGANGPSLNEARQHFHTIGVSAPEHLARMRREDLSRLPK